MASIRTTTPKTDEKREAFWNKMQSQSDSDNEDDDEEATLALDALSFAHEAVSQPVVDNPTINNRIRICAVMKLALDKF